MVSNPYAALIEKYSMLRGFEPSLIARQIQQESGFRPAVESVSGAIGLMQLLPGTALDLGFHSGDLRDPESNINAGTLLMQKFFHNFREVPDRFERLKFTLAAYNGGLTHIKLALQANAEAAHRMPLVWDLVKCWLFNAAGQVQPGTPDACIQIVLYVWKIWTNFERDRALQSEQAPPPRAA